MEDLKANKIDYVKIGDKRFNLVVFKKENFNNDITSQIDFQQSMISIADVLHEDEAKKSIMHNAMHGLLTFMGEDELEENEAVVSRIANGMLMMMKDNQELFKYLMKTD